MDPPPPYESTNTEGANDDTKLGVLPESAQDISTETFNSNEEGDISMDTFISKDVGEQSRQVATCRYCYINSVTYDLKYGTTFIKCSKINSLFMCNIFFYLLY